ncbi:MAG TPA: BlaI/MecI/CopY family transcriptional regulator [Planctomycetota bacterium]
MSSPLRLGDLQVAILRVLWDEGEATVARVTEALPGKRRAPTTIATMLTKMERKGLVDHRVDGRQFVYRAQVSEQEVTRTMVADLTQRLFEGDVSALVSHLIHSEEIDRDELVRLRALIVERERLEARLRTGEPARGGRDVRAVGDEGVGGDDDDE